MFWIIFSMLAGPPELKLAHSIETMLKCKISSIYERSFLQSLVIPAKSEDQKPLGFLQRLLKAKACNPFFWALSSNKRAKFLCTGG